MPGALSDNRSPNVFGRIRSACRQVAERATHVRVVEDRVAVYARSLLPSLRESQPADGRFEPSNNAEQTAALVLALVTTEFGSGYHPALQKRPGLSGSLTIAAGIVEQFAQHPFTASYLQTIDRETCARVCGQRLDDGPITELMTLFASAWNELGAFVETRYGGRFLGLVEDAEPSAEKLVNVLAELTSFRDVSTYRGLEVPFYKRAQLAASDLDRGLAQPEAPHLFADINQLTMFADNLVPHVLRVDGLLDYDQALAETIEAEALIPPGSEEEVEIRACGLHAVELIAAACTRLGSPAAPRDLDYLLWNRGQAPEYKARKRHRTRSPYY